MRIAGVKVGKLRSLSQYLCAQTTLCNIKKENCYNSKHPRLYIIIERGGTLKRFFNQLIEVFSKDWVIYVVIGLVVGLLLRSLLDQISKTPVDLFNNLVANIIDIALSVLFIDRLIKSREKKREQKLLLIELRQKMASENYEIALFAYEEIRRNNWHLDGSLKDINLVRANLREADLSGFIMDGADLVGADLRKSILSGAILRNANLKLVKMQEAVLVGTDLSASLAQNADMRGANLSNATLTDADYSQCNFENAIFDGAILKNVILRKANFSGALLSGADLRGADLSGANLSGAKLQDALLEGAIIRDAIFDGGTRLPDGSKYEVGIDIEKFVHNNA